LVVEFHSLYCDVSKCHRPLAASGLERDKILRASPNMTLEMYVNGRGKDFGSR
jgi:hypothetical protein